MRGEQLVWSDYRDRFGNFATIQTPLDEVELGWRAKFGLDMEAMVPRYQIELRAYDRRTRT